MDIDEARGFDKVMGGAVSELLLAEKGPPGAFVLRPYADLVGLPTSAVVSTDGPAGIAHLDRPEAFRELDLTTGVVPSLVTGHLELPSGEPSPTTIVFVLNGVVAGASELYEEGGKRHRFAAVLSPQYMREGSNALEAFTAEPEAGEIAFRPLGIGA